MAYLKAPIAMTLGVIQGHLSIAIFFSNGMIRSCKISTESASCGPSAIAELLVLLSVIVHIIVVDRMASNLSVDTASLCGD